jgi:NAD(P)-dependent dehydrogenase (short-subunit alcohol dehydrogenase family)
MPGSLAGKAVVVIGDGSPAHRAVAVAFAESGADLAIAGAPGMASEVLLHSIANEVWAIGPRGIVVTFAEGDATSYDAAIEAARAGLGRIDFIVRCEPPPEAKAVMRSESGAS